MNCPRCRAWAVHPSWIWAGMYWRLWVQCMVCGFMHTWEKGTSHEGQHAFENMRRLFFQRGHSSEPEEEFAGT